MLRGLLVLPFAGLALATEGGTGSLFDIDLSTLTKLPLWEPTSEEYFGSNRGSERDENGLPSPVVLTSPTHAEFVYHARRGYPIMVSDWGAGMQYDGWTCKNFAEAFPFGYIKAEYIHALPGFNRKDHDVMDIEGEMRFNIASFKPDKKTPWHNFSRPAAKMYKDDPLKPVSGPYVWHVKDELSEEQQRIVQQKFEAPPFLNDPLNSAWMNRTFEMWFSPGSGSGAGAHNDGYCESVVSLQLRGDKKWRKMLEPEMTFLHSYDEFDGGVYNAGRWNPDLGFTNSRGSAVIWPPGYLHETKTFPPPDGECGTAITLQFAFPQPVQFIRAFLPRLSLSAEVGQCFGPRYPWTGYATLFVPGMKPTPRESKIRIQLEKILKSVDADGDERVTVDEMRNFLRSNINHAGSDLGHYPPTHHDLFFQFRAEDTVAYHDMDDDMVVSRQELWDSLVQWNVVRIRVREGLKRVNHADREGLEAFEKSLDYLRRAPVELPTRLRPELEQLFKLPKGTKIFKNLKAEGVGSFSDTEFFSRARGRIDDLEDRMSRRATRMEM